MSKDIITFMQLAVMFSAVVSLFTRTSEDSESSVDITVLLDFPSFISTMLSNFVVLMTFGIMSPLLAITVATSIYLSCLYMQFLVGRFISIQSSKVQPISTTIDDAETSKVVVESNNLLAELEKDCDGQLFERSIYQMRFIIVFIASLFMAAFLMDTAGDKVGWKGALVYPLTMIGATIVMMIGHFYFRTVLKRNITVSVNTTTTTTSHSDESSTMTKIVV